MDIIYLFCFAFAGKGCKGKADVGFIVDVSGSVSSYYSDEQKFVKELAAALNLAPSGSRAGVVQFSSSAKLHIKFSDHDNINDFKTAVDALPNTGGGTRIDKGMDVAFTEMFKAKNGMRGADVPKVAIVMTDGCNNKPLEPMDAAKKFRDANIRVIVVAIGNDIKRAELLSLVEVDTDLHLAKDFAQLVSQSFIDSVTSNCTIIQRKSFNISSSCHKFQFILIHVFTHVSFSHIPICFQQIRQIAHGVHGTHGQPAPKNATVAPR